MFESVSATPHKLLRGQAFSNFQIPKFSNSAEFQETQKIRCPLFFIFSPVNSITNCTPLMLRRVWMRS